MPSKIVTFLLGLVFDNSSYCNDFSDMTYRGYNKNVASNK